MPEVAVVNSDGAEVGKMTLSPEVFEVKPNTSIVHRAVVDHLATLRQGTADTKTRGEVSGGGRKPYRQKGTGRARQGSIRAPHYYHGGVVWGPHPRDYSAEMPKKMRRLALRSALSVKFAEGQIKVLDELKLDAISTKRLVEVLAPLTTGKTMLILAQADENIKKSAKNIPWLIVRMSPSICTYELLNSDVVLFTKEALAKLEEAHAK